jgi:hemin uptake protein HemP
MPESADPSENRPPAASAGQADMSVAASHPPLPKIVPFSELARCGEEIWISHQGQLYRLQSTRSGKLILTK